MKLHNGGNCGGELQEAMQFEQKQIFYTGDSNFAEWLQQETGSGYYWSAHGDSFGNADV